MEIKMIKFIMLVVLSTSALAQKTKLDTLKMFEGHWVFKAPINSKFSSPELKDTYIKPHQKGKIHIRGKRLYGNFVNNSYENYIINSLGKVKFSNFEMLNEEEYSLIEVKKMSELGIGINQKTIGLYYDPDISINFYILHYYCLQKKVC